MHQARAEVAYLEGRFDAAIAHAQEAIAADAYDPRPFNTLGHIHYERFDFAGAKALFLRAITLQADYMSAHLGLAGALMMLGDLRAGFREYEWRLKGSRRLPVVDRPRWNGMKVPGRLAVVVDEGFGDCLQYSRYLPLCRPLCDRLILLCGETQADLFRPLVDEIHIDFTGAIFDAWCPMASLPMVFATTLETIPPPVFKTEGPRKGGVGLCWQGRGYPHRDRSIPDEAMVPLLAALGSRAVVLPREGSFADTAAIMAELDLVISIDSAPAHLAGSLGIPTWLLLRHLGDWRWMQRPDSPWYPSMRIFRQPAVGDWAGVIARVIVALAQAKAA